MPMSVAGSTCIVILFIAGFGAGVLIVVGVLVAAVAAKEVNRAADLIAC
jgi:hypothetical protein